MLIDGEAVDPASPLRSFVVDSFTQIALNGPACLATNNGYAQLVSFFGTFCWYHAKSLKGGQLNLSNCTTDFGEYGLIADGKSAHRSSRQQLMALRLQAQRSFRWVPSPGARFGKSHGR